MFSLGLHTIIEEVAWQFSSVKFLWYVDDGVLMGSPQEVTQALNVLQSRLQQADLELNLLKCEAYSRSSDSLGPLSSIHILTQPASWTYLCAPIVDVESSCCMQAYERSKALAERIKVFQRITARSDSLVPTYNGCMQD